jgi:phospholipid transport system substrate-binding protein
LRSHRTMTIFTVAAALAVLPCAVRYARAQTQDPAVSFVKDSASALVAIANSSASSQEKHRQIAQVLDRSVDLEGIARGSLGRFWHTATPEQQVQYTTLSRDLLVTKIADHIGEYHGVRLTMGAARIGTDGEVVATTVEQPGAPADEVDWVVSNTTGGPKIVDLLAEGTSMRQTQSSDFTAYLASHQFDINQLIQGLRQKVAVNQ